MTVEIEFRARFAETKYLELFDYLEQHAVDLGANDKHIYFYVLPDRLLKVVDNVSTGTAKVSLKNNRLGQGSSFPEIEMEIDRAHVGTAVQIFNDLGFKDAMHDAFNRRHDFRYQGVEIALKHSEAWGIMPSSRYSSTASRARHRRHRRQLVSRPWPSNWESG